MCDLVRAASWWQRKLSSSDFSQCLHCKIFFCGWCCGGFWARVHRMNSLSSTPLDTANRKLNHSLRVIAIFSSFSFFALLPCDALSCFCVLTVLLPSLARSIFLHCESCLAANNPSLAAMYLCLKVEHIVGRTLKSCNLLLLIFGDIDENPAC